MAKRRELTNEEIADQFIHFGRNMAYAGIMEVVYIAARLEEPLEDAVTAHERASTFEDADRLTTNAARQMAEVAGMRRLIAAVVKRYAFLGAFGDGEDRDPDGSRSRYVAELLLKHAAQANRMRRDAS